MARKREGMFTKNKIKLIGLKFFVLKNFYFKISFYKILNKLMA